MQNINKVKEIFYKKKSKRLLWENIVIEYWNYYYKTLSKFWKFMYKWEKKYSNLLKYKKIIEENFWDICEIAETEIIKDPEFHYIIKQKTLEWKIMEVSDLKDENIQKKFKIIIKRNKDFWNKKWYFLDLFWTDMFFSPFKIHNLIVCNWEIYIFDFWLLNKNSKNKAFRITTYFFYLIQSFLIFIILKFYK